MCIEADSVCKKVGNLKKERKENTLGLQQDYTMIRFVIRDYIETVLCTSEEIKIFVKYIYNNKMITICLTSKYQWNKSDSLMYPVLR